MKKMLCVCKLYVACKNYSLNVIHLRAELCSELFTGLPEDKAFRVALEKVERHKIPSSGGIGHCHHVEWGPEAKHTE